MNKRENKILSFFFHFLVVVVLAVAFWPFVRGYLFSSQPAGNDYYTSLIYTEFFKKYLTWPPAGWENFWFSGISVFNGYPWPFFYFIQPLVRIVGSGWGIEIYSVAALFLFFVFSYFLFWELSQNYLFSLLLSLILLNTFSVFNALPWNGFVTASASQMFLPLVLWFVIRFCRTGEQKSLVAASLLNGLAILIHPTNGLLLILIPALLLLFFWPDQKTKLWPVEKIKFCLLFCLVAFLIGSTVLYPFLSYTFTKASKLHCIGTACRGRIPFLVGGLNPFFYVLTIFFLGAILLGKIFHKQFDFQKRLVFLLPLFYLLIFIIGEHLNFLESISPLMWPERLIWAVALFLGMILANFWGIVFQSQTRLLKTSTGIILSGTILFLIFGPSQPFDKYGWASPLVLDFSSLLAPVGAFPEETYSFTVDKYKTRDVSETLPSWLKPNDFNYRFDSFCATINFWWNLVTAVPNTRGYVNLMQKNQSFWYGWLSSGMMNWWEKGVTRPKEIAQKTANFLIDWYAIRYLEEHYDDAPYADFILQEPVIDRKEEISRPNIHPLFFDRIAEEKTSPIVKASKAPTILVVGKKDTFVYDNLVKLIAAENLNSQFLVPIRGPETLDELKKYNLGDFNAIFLSGYRYEDFRSWNILTDYVKNGGRLIIDTGTEVHESDNATLPEGESLLPEVFPSQKTKRESLGTDWQLTVGEHQILNEVNVNEFGPLLYENNPWKLSFVPETANVKRGAEIILSQKGHPILVSWKMGNGEVIWSGLNLLYHFQSYDRPAESRLFANMLSFLLGGLSRQDTDFSLERKRPEKVLVSGNDFSGVVFKEHFDSGWQAKINGKRVKIYPAGPDFMYVRVPKETRGEIKIEFTYRGTPDAWFFFVLSLGTIGVTSWYLVVGKGFGFGLLISAKRKVGEWWAKEEER